MNSLNSMENPTTNIEKNYKYNLEQYFDARMMDKFEKLSSKEALKKQLILAQIGKISGKTIVDFGSKNGFLADYYAEQNRVIAVEKDEIALADRYMDHEYIQLIGGVEELQKLEAESVDYIFCHNVLEYINNKEEVIREFNRILRPNGHLSVVKYNCAGSVMQSVMEKNFEKAYELLQKDKNGGKNTDKFGKISFFEDADLVDWCSDLDICRTYGIRTFYGLSEEEKSKDWQERMFDLEMQVATQKEYREIAFFHHLILTKLVVC